MWPIIALSIAGLSLLLCRYLLLRRCRPPEGRGELDVSIIVPARNEEHNLPPLLESLARLNPPPREVIVVDDQSEDRTNELARSFGARVVEAGDRPSGWNGKPWACRAGAAVARGEYLLFTDADTVHAPDSLARVAAALQSTGADLLSVVPTHRARKLWEQLQGVFHLLLLIATGAGSERGSGERRFVIGQYILMNRQSYERVGGHAAVRGRIAEDLALGRLVSESGGTVTTVFCPGLLRVQMYPEGVGAFFRGWRRSFHEGMGAAGPWAVMEISVVMGWLLGAPSATLLALAGDDPLWWIPALLVITAVISIGMLQRALGDFPLWSALFYPLFVVLFVMISFVATVGKALGAQVEWKGRRVSSI